MYRMKHDQRNSCISMNEYPHVHSQNLLKLISIEFKECLADSPSFRASINYKIKEIKDKYINIDYNAFTLKNLDDWLYSSITDNQVIKIYHTYIRSKLTDEITLHKNDIKDINSLLKSINNYILDFEQYDTKLNDLIIDFSSTNYLDNDDLYKKDAMNLYTLKIKHLNNALNLIHELKIIKVNLNIKTMKIILKLYEKSIQSTDCFVYSETIVKLENLLKNCNKMYHSQKVLKKDINVNKNLIIKSFKKNYDPEQFLRYDLKTFNEELAGNKLRDYDLYEFKGWFYEIKNDQKNPKFIFIKKNIFGIFEVSNDGTYVTETDKFGINLVKFKVLDLNNEENGYKRFSFMLTFKSPNSEDSFDVIFQSISSLDLCKLHSTIMNIQDQIDSSSLPKDIMDISNKRFSPLFKEFFIEDMTSPLVNYTNRDSISLFKKIEKHVNKDLSISVGLRLLNNIDMPISTSLTNLALFANVYITLSTNFVPNGVIANTWGSDYWTSLFIKNEDKFNYFSQLYVKTQSDAALSMHNIPFKMLFGYMKEETGCVSMNCLLYFTKSEETSEKDDNIYFKGSVFATHKKLYFYLNSYGLFSLLTIPLEDILDIKLIKGDNEQEPLKMIIYDKKQLNIGINISFIQYYKMKEQYVDRKDPEEYFLETISLLSLKEKILYLIDVHSQNSRRKSNTSLLNQQRSLKEDETMKRMLHKIDYKYYLKNKEQEKLILFKKDAKNGVQVKRDNNSDIADDVILDNKIDLLDFKTSISTKYSWEKIHKLEVPIRLDALGLLFLGKKNVFASNLYIKIYDLNSKHDEKTDQNDEDVDYNSVTDIFPWIKQDKIYIRQYKALLKEKKIFYTDEAKLNMDDFNTNEIVVKDKLLQYIPNENLILKMEFGKFEIPLVGLTMLNLYFIVEKIDSTKSKISFYLEIYPLNEIQGNQYLKRLIFEILKNYLYKRHLKSLLYFKHTLSKFYKNMGKSDDQYIKCLKISSTIDFEEGSVNITENNTTFLKINRVKLLKLIIKHYLVRIGITSCLVLKRIYLILGTLITNILLINKTLMLGLIISIFLNLYLLSNDFFKTLFLTRKLDNVMKNDIVVQRSLSIGEFDALINNNSLKMDEDKGLLNNFILYTLDKSAYQSKKESIGIERNELLVDLDILKQRELKLMKEEYADFIRKEIQFCMKFEKDNFDYENQELKNYCDNVVDSYVATELL